MTATPGTFCDAMVTMNSGSATLSVAASVNCGMMKTGRVIANGSEPNILIRLVNGERLGTRFLSVAGAVESRKRYILSARRTAGHVDIDEGAAKALRKGGSLLPVGVLSVSGTFERGDIVRVLDPLHKEIARGIANYSSGDLAQLARRRSEEIESILGYNFGDEIIHRNNLVVL